jgi:hypothetical protein
MGAADLYSNSNGDQVDVRFYMAIPDDADTWFGKATELLASFAEIEDERPVNVAGNQGRQYELHPSQDGRELFLIRSVLLDGGDAWDVTWVSEAGNEAADRARFETMLASFERVAAFRNVWGLEVGSCFDSLPLAPDRDGGASILFVGPVDGFALADCGQPHTGEIIAALGSETDTCDAVFEPFVGRALAGSAYILLEFMPLQETDLPPGVTKLCAVTDSSGISSGSAKGGAR